MTCPVFADVQIMVKFLRQYPCQVVPEQLPEFLSNHSESNHYNL